MKLKVGFEKWTVILNVICVFIIEIINRIKYEMEIFGSAVVFSSIVLFVSSCKRMK
jgi:hypothetical protein